MQRLSVSFLVLALSVAACEDDETGPTPDAAVGTADGGVRDGAATGDGPAGTSDGPAGTSDGPAATGDTARADTGSTGDGSSGGADAAGTSAMMNFFVTSRTGSGNLGGLAGADAICKQLATAVGQGSKNWVAYLSTTTPMVNAKDRIGEGPWYNAAGRKIADTTAELHQLDPPLWPRNDPGIALNERGERIPGREDPEIPPNEHDIITGTKADGTADVNNCNNWTSETMDHKATVGHHDRRGPMVDVRNEWNSTHTSNGCQAGSTGIGSGGGAGRFYCFAKK